MHCSTFSQKKFEKKYEFSLNNFVEIPFCCIAFSVFKFLICFRILFANLAKKKIFHLDLFQILFIQIYLDEFVYCALNWVLCLILKRSFKVSTGDFFQIWNYTCKKLVKSCTCIIITGNDFFDHYLFFTFRLYSLF